MYLKAEALVKETLVDSVEEGAAQVNQALWFGPFWMIVEQKVSVSAILF